MFLEVYAVTRIEKIEQQIRSLSPEELAALRLWFANFDAEVWDRQFEADVNYGKLDAMAERALRAHAAGQSTKL
jgi:hypothetical protein